MPYLVLDKDGVLTDSVEASRKTLLHAYKSQGKDEAYSFLSTLPRDHYISYFQRAVAIPFIAHRYLRTYSYFLALSRVFPKEPTKEEILKASEEGRGIYAQLPTVFMELVNSQPLYPFARKFLYAYNKPLAILSAAEGVKEWIEREFPRFKGEVYEGVFDKSDVLYELSLLHGELLFITDEKIDVLQTRDAITRGASISIVGVLTGFSTKKDFDELGIPYYSNLLEAAVELSLTTNP